MAGRIPLTLIAALCVTSTVLACMWDIDTLQQERSRFPSALELMTGKFLRHSPEFYRWRIDDRLRRLESEPNNLALYDDVAVAWDKLGESDRAIEYMVAKDRLSPGQYETLANLGTFHIHAGRLKEGVEFIRHAIAVNPEAHFGREEYQLLLVEYVLSRQSAEGAIPRPLHTGTVDDLDRYGFAEYVLERKGTGEDEIEAEIERALTGVMGMMRFGRHDSPLLLEVLGDLLVCQNWGSQKGELAARAYLKASYESEDEGTRTAYRRKAAAALDHNYLTNTEARPLNDEVVRVAASESPRDKKLALVEQTFAAEMEDARQWFAELAAREHAWLANGSVNPDVEFARLYAADPIVESPEVPRRVDSLERKKHWLKVLSFVLISVFVIVAAMDLTRRRRAAKLSGA